MISYFTTHLLPNLVVKEFLKSVNIWQVTDKMVDCVIRPICLKRLSSKMQNSPDKKNNLCITDRNCCYSCCKIDRQINVSLLSTNITQTSFDSLTDRLTPSVTDRLLIISLHAAYCCNIFIFLTAVVYSR